MRVDNIFLRKIITDLNNYCCLCMDSILENDSSHNLIDEIVLQTERVEDIYEILFNVLGEEVMNSLSSTTICKNCTVLAVKSYMFIDMCKNNVQRLSSNIDCLQNYLRNATSKSYCHKSLFLVLDSGKNTIDEFYDRNFCHRSLESVHKRFKSILSNSLSIQNIGNSVTLDIHYEPENFHTNERLVTDVISSSAQEPSPKTLSGNINNINHVKNSPPESNYVCGICSKGYKSALKLRKHHLRVHAPKTFKCSLCPRSFGTSLILNCHIKNSHSTGVCRFCGKTYSNSHSLKHHEKTHEVNFKCNNCSKVYKGKKSFNNHVKENLCNITRNINLIKTHTCKYCYKQYSQISALNVHVRLKHEDGNTLICDWCGKKLSSQSKYKEHIVKHTKQKKYHCDICGGQFVTKSSLLYHIRTHTGEKPYQCEHCDMKFLSVSRRSVHVKTHHIGADLECDICHSKLKGQSNLTRHKKRHLVSS